jgi:hypothetical protein
VEVHIVHGVAEKILYDWSVDSYARLRFTYHYPEGHYSKHLGEKVVEENVDQSHVGDCKSPVGLVKQRGTLGTEVVGNSSRVCLPTNLADLVGGGSATPPHHLPFTPLLGPTSPPLRVLFVRSHAYMLHCLIPSLEAVPSDVFMRHNYIGLLAFLPNRVVAQGKAKRSAPGVPG